MGKAPDLPKQKPKAAPVTPESEEVRAAGQRAVDAQRKKSGRMSTFLTNPSGATGYAGGYNKPTGSV